MYRNRMKLMVICSFVTVPFIVGIIRGAVTPTLQLPVYFIPKTIDSYFYKPSITNMTEWTICLWFKGVVDDDRRTHDWLLATYNNAGGGDNELSIALWNSTMVALWIGGTSRYIDVTYVDIEPLWIGWNKHCFTWKSNDRFKWYSDKEETGVLELIGEVSVGANVVTDGGRLVLFQEYDNGGNFDINQAGYGGLAWFNIWSEEKNETELNNLGCKAKGDVVSMDTLQMVGEIATWEEPFPCVDGELPSLKQVQGYNLKTKMFCTIPGGSLSAVYTISTEQTTTVAKCATLCSRSDNCLSATYHIPSHYCTLNNITNQGGEGNFDTTLCGVDCVFLTTIECK